MALKLSYEPAITATVTAGLVTAASVGAALNAADMPAGWDWMETVVPIGLFLAYLLVGLVIRPLVVPNAKVKELQAAVTELKLAPPSNVNRLPRTGGITDPAAQAAAGERYVDPKTGNWTTSGYPGGDGPVGPPST